MLKLLYGLYHSRVGMMPYKTSIFNRQTQMLKGAILFDEIDFEQDDRRLFAAGPGCLWW